MSRSRMVNWHGTRYWLPLRRQRKRWRALGVRLLAHSAIALYPRMPQRMAPAAMARIAGSGWRRPWRRRGGNVGKEIRQGSHLVGGQHDPGCSDTVGWIENRPRQDCPGIGLQDLD